MAVLKRHRRVKFVLLGVGWSSASELRLLRAAKLHGMRVVVYLDHWVNYRERFGYPRSNWKENLPHEIWLGDAHGISLARKLFPKQVKLRTVPNRHFAEMQEQYRRLARSGAHAQRDLLFISEPLSKPLNSFGDPSGIRFTETGVLRDLLQCLHRLHFAHTIIVRLHPMERRNKYDHLAARYSKKLALSVSGSHELIHDIAPTRVVVGMDSMALYIASLCGTMSISYIPNSSYRRTLPPHSVVRASSKKALYALLAEALDRKRPI